MEGELKRIKNFFSSSKDTYKLENNILLIKRVVNKKIEYKKKYDLKLYDIRLSVKGRETFYLEPNKQNQHLNLNKLEFKCKSAEERAVWFLAI